MARVSEPRGAPRRVRYALLGLLWLLETAQALAQPAEPVELAWSAPQGCPGADEVQARVRKLAGSAKLTGAPLHADATIARDEDGPFHLKLVVRVDSFVGERHIDGKSCHDLAGATAVALALLLRSATPLTEADLRGSAPADVATSDLASSGLHSRAQGPASTGAPSASTAAASQAALNAGSNTAPPAHAAQARGDADPQHAAQRARRWRVLLQLPLVVLGVGPLHQPSYGLAFSAGASFLGPRARERASTGPWYTLAEGRVWLPQRSSAVHQAERYSADVQRFAAGLRGCRAFLWPRFQLAPCIAISAEHLSARGKGAHIAGSEAKASWVALGLGAQARLPLVPWLNLIAGIDLQFQTSRPTIAIDGVGVIEQLLPVALNVVFGSEWIL